MEDRSARTVNKLVGAITAVIFAVVTLLFVFAVWRLKKQPKPVNITITSTPVGDAPQWVREAWVGITLSSVGLVTTTGTGVLYGSSNHVTGYRVRYDEAITKLWHAGKTNAVAWWIYDAHAFDSLIFPKDAAIEIR